MVKQATIELSTRGNGQMVDITGEVENAVGDSGLRDGLVTVFVPGATGSVTTIEYESGLERDFEELMEKLIPQNRDRDYHHNERWGDGNGHSHVRASLLGPSMTVPLKDERLTQGLRQK